MRSLTQILGKTLSVRAGEGTRLLIMAGYIFVVIASYNVLKPMTRSLFVSRLGLEQLPGLYILLAVCVTVFVVFYLRFSAKMRLDRLINISIVALMVSLLLFRWLLQRGVETPALYYSLFIWASIYGVLTTSQFWLLANFVFNAREAKRLFSILTSFGLAGAILGGYFTRFLVTVIGGTANLAFFCLALLIIGQILMNLAWRRRHKSIENTRWAHAAKESEASFRIIGQTFSLIRNSRHLALLICIVALTYMVVQIADFQFIAYASSEITDLDELTGFLGFWLSNLSVFALFFQFLFAGVILKRFGVGATVLFLPITLFITSAWVFLSYGIVSILAIKVGDGAFRHSINKVGMELLYLPIPQEIKQKTKTFIDMFADRFARGLAGVLLLVFYTWLGFTISQVALLSVVFTSLWIVIAVATYREYVNSFRNAISRRQIDLESASVTIHDQGTINSLVKSLASKNERQVVYGLQVLQSVTGVDLATHVAPLLDHESAEVRCQVLNLILAHRLVKLQADIWPLLHDADENVRREAVKVLAEMSDDPEASLSEWLAAENIELRGAALHYIAGSSELARKLLSLSSLRAMINTGERARALVAEAIGALQNETYYDDLAELLDDPVYDVRVRAIESAGRTRARQFAPILVNNLKNRSYRTAVRKALAQYGDGISAQLARYLQDSELDLAIRLELPRVLSLIGSQLSVDVLLEQLPDSNQLLRHQVIKGLSKLRTKFPDLTFDKRVDHTLIEELKRYFSLLATVQMSVGNSATDSKQQLLGKALKERLDDHFERIFRLLGLRYSPRDIYNAFAAATSVNGSVRSNAIEFLDNILSKKHKKILLPIVDDLSTEQLLKHGNSLFQISVTDCYQALKDLIKGNDSWLSACALYHVGVSGTAASYRTEIDQALQSSHNVVRETAGLVLKQFA